MNRKLFTPENLKATDRNHEPRNINDYNYFVDQLVSCGRLSVHDADGEYIDTEVQR